MEKPPVHTSRLAPPALAQSPSGAGATGAPAANFLQLLANSPAATEAYLSWERALGARGRLSHRQRELLALTVAEINGSKYDLEVHARIGSSLGLSEEEIGQARKAMATSSADRALLQFGRAVLLQRGVISDADFRDVRRAGFGDAEIAEAIATIAANVFANYFNAVARTPCETAVGSPAVA